MRYVAALKPSNSPVWIFCNQEYADAITDIESLTEYLRGYAYCGANENTIRTAKNRSGAHVTYIPFYWNDTRRTISQLAQGLGVIEPMPTPFDHYTSDRRVSINAYLLSTLEATGTLSETSTKGPVPIYKLVEENYAIGLNSGGLSYRCRITSSATDNLSSIGSGSTTGIGTGIKVGIYTSQYQHAGSTTSSTSGYDFILNWTSRVSPKNPQFKHSRPLTRAEIKGSAVIREANPNFSVLSLGSTSLTKQLFPMTDTSIKSVVQVIGSSLVKFSIETVTMVPVGEHQVDLTVKLPIVQTAIKV